MQVLWNWRVEYFKFNSQHMPAACAGRSQRQARASNLNAMSEKVKKQIDEIKAEIGEWPNDQKRSFVDGIATGLHLAVIAKLDGCDIVNDKDIAEFTSCLDGNWPPVKRRNKSAQKLKSARDQLAEDIKDFLRRAIACRLRISKDAFDTSLDTEDEVNKLLLTVIAIANRSELDDAIHDIQIMRSITGGGLVDRESIKSEVETCYEKFPIEIAAIERFNELSKRSSFKVNDIWIYLRSNMGLDYGYEDDKLREIDARYQ